MIENVDVIITIVGGFIAVIGLQLNIRGEIKDVKAQSDEKDARMESKLSSIQREFDLCPTHRKISGGNTNE